MNICQRCTHEFVGRYPGSKICKVCSKRGMPRGAAHWNYKTGAYINETIRQEFRQQTRYCADCWIDLKEASRYMWVLHHKDHNHANNDPANWQLLCKRCHQIEHECWKAFTRRASEYLHRVSDEDRNQGRPQRPRAVEAV